MSLQKYSSNAERQAAYRQRLAERRYRAVDEICSDVWAEGTCVIENGSNCIVHQLGHAPEPCGEEWGKFLYPMLHKFVWLVIEERGLPVTYAEYQDWLRIKRNNPRR